MKIAELSELEQKQIDEAPAGMLKQIGRRVGAAAAGAIGMKNTAANLTGKADVGKTANDVFTKFNTYLGTQQKNVKTATGDDLANFLQNTYNYNQAKIPQGTLNKQQIYDIINKMASDGYAQMGKGGGAGGGTAQATQGGQQQASGQRAAQQGTGGKAVGGDASKPVSKAGTKQAAGGAGANATQIPTDVQKMLDTLSATEKQALVGMLK